MSTAQARKFVAHWLAKEQIDGKRILDVGCGTSHPGFVRRLVSESPSTTYVGSHLFSGPNVDVVCDAHDLASRFEDDYFDIVLSTEVVSHTRNWRTVINNMKKLCRPDGLVMVTVRSLGYPSSRMSGYDYWRYEDEDMRTIFRDCDMLALETDVPEKPGVLVAARSPSSGKPCDLRDVKLYSMVRRRRARSVYHWEGWFDDFRHKNGQRITSYVPGLALRTGKRIVGWK